MNKTCQIYNIHIYICMYMFWFLLFLTMISWSFGGLGLQGLFSCWLLILFLLIFLIFRVLGLQELIFVFLVQFLFISLPIFSVSEALGLQVWICWFELIWMVVLVFRALGLQGVILLISHLIFIGFNDCPDVAGPGVPGAGFYWLLIWCFIDFSDFLDLFCPGVPGVVF